jgi:Zn-dependent protease with chaperone function
MIVILSSMQSVCHAMLEASLAGALVFLIAIFATKTPGVSPGVRQRCWSAAAIFPLIAFAATMLSATFFGSVDVRAPLRFTTPVVDPFDIPLQRASRPIAGTQGLPEPTAQRLLNEAPNVGSFARLASWLVIAVLFWFAVVGAMVGRILWLLFSAHRLVRKASRGAPLSTEESKNAGVSVVWVDELPGPIAVGLWQQSILIPRQLRNGLRESEVRSVCAHEVAHLVRRDDRWDILERLARAVMWLNPLVHVAIHQARLWREASCDRWAAERAGGRNLAQALVRSADFLARCPCAPTTLGFIGAGSLVKRVESLIHPPPISPLVTKLAATVLWVAFAVAGVAVAARASSFLWYDVRVVDTASMHDARANFAFAKLHDGSVLVAGGMQSVHRLLAGAELYDPRAATFRRVGSLAEPVAGAVATVLKDGNVLITGGRTNDGPTARASIFDTRRATFVQAGSLLFARSDHTATLLNDGRVLVIGGRGPRNTLPPEAEIYDPSSKRFSAAGNLLQPRWGHSATMLDNGTVLVAGGLTGTSSLRSTEIYAPEMRQFRLGPAMLEPRSRHGAIRLDDGGVLLVGGSRTYAWSGVENSAERFDARKSRFLPVGAMMLTSLKLANALVKLPNGNIMVAGGSDRIELYDARRHKFSVLSGSLGHLRSQGAAVELNDCAVLVVGGYDVNGNRAVTTNSVVRIE